MDGYSFRPPEACQNYSMEQGRPAKYDTPEQMEVALNAYFQKCEADKTPLTITGVALALGFESRQSFYDYEERDGFSYIIKQARLRVENGYEITLRSASVTGSIFALKNMGWKDKTEVDQNHDFKGKPQINLIVPDGLTID